MTDDPSGWEIDLSFLGSGFRLKRFMRHSQGDIEVCTTRIVRSGLGFPWDERIAIHPLPDGKLEIRRLARTKPNPSPEWRQARPLISSAHRAYHQHKASNFINPLPTT